MPDNRLAGVPFDEWDAIAGLIRPEFVEIPDGYYTQRVVLDERLATRYMRAGDPPSVLASHVEPLPNPVPRYRRKLRWVRSL